jgi:hypothetical protein
MPSPELLISAKLMLVNQIVFDIVITAQEINSSE